MPRPATFQFSIDDTRCTRCGLCVADCPMRVISQEPKEVPFVKPEKEAQCIHCQHCLAICPSAALSIDGKRPEDSLPVGGLPDLESMDHLVRCRRSVRSYKPENVEAGLVKRLLTTLGNVPTGTNSQQLTFHLIDDREVMDRFRQAVMATLEKADQEGRIPDRLAVLRTAYQVFAKNGTDILFRGAPHMLLVSAPKNVATPHQDVALTLATFELLAQSAGLGTVWSGFTLYALETVPELKPLLGLDPGHAYYAMPFGLPKVHYARTVQRDEAALIHRVTL
ncbi:MAG: nitroreductase [Holophagaceae bacterium]|nr:nitroreductase [Holophagaceae bacterium]